MNKPRQIAQVVECLGMMHRSLQSLVKDELPGNPQGFAVMAEGPIDDMRDLLDQLDAHVATLAPASEFEEPPGVGSVRADHELKAAQERVAYLQRLLARLRMTASPEEYEAVSSRYRTEIVGTQQEILAYLSRHATADKPAEAA